MKEDLLDNFSDLRKELKENQTIKEEVAKVRSRKLSLAWPGEHSYALCKLDVYCLYSCYSICLPGTIPLMREPTREGRGQVKVERPLYMRTN